MTWPRTALNVVFRPCVFLLALFALALAVWTAANIFEQGSWADTSPGFSWLLVCICGCCIAVLIAAGIWSAKLSSLRKMLVLGFGVLLAGIFFTVVYAEAFECWRPCGPRNTATTPNLTAPVERLRGD